MPNQAGLEGFFLVTFSPQLASYTWNCL